MDAPVKLPVYSRSTLPDPKLFFDCMLSVLENDMQTRTPLISNGIAWVSLGGGGGGGTWGSITGTLASQTDLNTALGLKAPLASPALTGAPTAPTQAQADNSTKIATTAYADTLGGTKVTLLAPAAPGAGNTAIARAAHLNRPLTVNQAAATTGTFAPTGTSGAQDGDGFELKNIGTAPWTATGSITAAPGYSLTALPGQLFTALYDATNDVFISTTPNQLAALNEMANAPVRIFGPNAIGDNQLRSAVITVPATVDSSVFGTPATSDGSMGFWSRARMNTAAAAINRGAGVFGTTAVNNFRLDGLGEINGGFPMVFRWALNHTASTGARVAIGMTANAGVATYYNADPSSQISVDEFIVAADAGDANLSVMWNDNASTPTKVTLGANFPKTADVPYICVFDRTAAGVPFVTILNRLNNIQATVIMNDANAPRTTISYGYQLIVGTGTDSAAVGGIDIGMCSVGGPSI